MHTTNTFHLNCMASTLLGASQTKMNKTWPFFQTVLSTSWETNNEQAVRI